ncbi:hypothetical protein A1A1_09721 [Planococcus antarcticus DSM 14505]|uniref:Uncharacterized protein n=1 Tax=Planococcus antarcticus DSM 14505 TaxID=1185653 RepID=A0AA87ILI3_9BACL|nr:hypothetical protein A1A1_09721 [Planococcus antarcticus DSM 14505]
MSFQQIFSWLGFNDDRPPAYSVNMIENGMLPQSSSLTATHPNIFWRNEIILQVIDIAMKN